MKLRDYQENTIESLKTALRVNKRVVMQAPTGAGKTVMFSYMVKEALFRGKEILIITDRIELLNQSGGALDKFGIKPELIASAVKYQESQVHLAMVETLHRRLKKNEDLIKYKDLIIIDEAHKSCFDKIFPYISDSTFVIGATATPLRKGNQTSLDYFYSSLISSIGTLELIQKGSLSKPEYFGVNIDLSGIKVTQGEYNSQQLHERFEKLNTFKGVVDNYDRLAKNQKAIIFSSSIKTSQRLQEEFNRDNTFQIHSKMPRNKVDEVVSQFKKSENGILLNVGIATTGFDCPNVRCIILNRATTSLVLFLQMVGRGARVTESKNSFIVLDFGNNIQRFGFWENERTWSLKKFKKKDLEAAPVKHCPHCEAILPAPALKCKFCGYIFPVKKKTEKEVILERITFESLRGKRIGDLSINDLIVLQEYKVYKSSFIWRVLRSKGMGSVKEYAKIMGYSSGWCTRQLSLPNNYSNTTIR